MGSSSSSFTQEEFEQMKAYTNFSEQELLRLHRRFKKLDTDGSGTLTTDEFLNIPELASNPLLERILSIFDKNQNNEIEFEEFISGLSIFTKGSMESKLKFVFQVYDLDRDGYISNGELFHALKMMIGNNLNDLQLQQIVDKTILETDKDEDGKISFDEFLKAIEGTREDVDSKLSIPF